MRNLKAEEYEFFLGLSEGNKQAVFDKAWEFYVCAKYEHACYEEAFSHAVYFERRTQLTLQRITPEFIEKMKVMEASGVEIE